ncbi:MAG: sigma-54 dependent transcriptional regulator [bacterium]|jgi:DNA-binding NtrC family response regulator|nr:sigma-54 dependent transcriptional regulator [candidate division KSB1 bacterium]MDH7561463.1 sigma-54 dependent transcriptional regulator [bacterium]
MRAHLLIVEDNCDMCQTLADVLRREGYSVRTAYSGEEAIQIVEKYPVDLVLLDLRLPKMDGLQVLAHIKEIDPDVLVIMITAVSDPRPAVAAMKAGAYDYLNKPFELDELKMVVAKALETIRLKLEVSQLKAQQRLRSPLTELFGDSPQMQEVRRLIKIVSETPRTSVLIQGESGTGKELVADAIHRNSVRADKPLVKVNCAAIPENLLESELFGHERGAFTDAKTMKKGIFEMAHGGSIFLDEISSMSPALQPKLLRVLESGSFRRVGGTADIEVDVRIIAATNRDLAQCVREGTFREDLYYRLKVMVIDLPPLREHPEDIIPLAKLFLEANNREFNKNIRGIDKEAQRLLLEYPWPGNVRELKNVIERAVILCPGDLLTADLLHLGAAPFAAKPITSTTQPTSVPDALDEVEKRHILQVLEKYGGNKSMAARALNISRSTLREKLKSYGVE